MIKLIGLFYSLNVLAGEGTGHSHGPSDGSGSMQVIGTLVIVLVAIAGFWFLSKKNK